MGNQNEEDDMGEVSRPSHSPLSNDNPQVWLANLTLLHHCLIASVAWITSLGSRGNSGNDGQDSLPYNIKKGCLTKAFGVHRP